MRAVAKVSLVLISVMLLVLGACAPQSAPAPQAPSTAPRVPAPAAPAAAPQQPLQAKEAWQVKWDALTEAGKKEGKVVMYTAAGAEVRAALQRGLKESFGLNAEFISGQVAELGTKVLAERRAGLRLGDVSVGIGSEVMLRLKSAGSVEVIEPGGVLVLPEVSDGKAWFRGGLRWQDATTRTSVIFQAYEMQNVAGNMQLIKAGEIQSYTDLLNPKWKGKLLMRDPTKTGGGLKAVAMLGRYNMGWDFVRSLAKQEPIVMTDLRLQMDWLARGKYPLAFGFKSSELYDFQNLGMPVDTIKVKEGGYLSSGNGTVSLLKDAPHPNAAKVFINWLLGKEGQAIFARADGRPSGRQDVSDQGLMYPRPGPDCKAPDGDTEEAIFRQDEDLKTVREIFLPIMQK